METNKQNQEVKKEDEDVHFERDETSTTSSSPEIAPEPEKTSMTGTRIPPEEELMGDSDFPPLTDQDKQPKLHDDERIRELNNKTSLGD